MSKEYKTQMKCKFSPNPHKELQLQEKIHIKIYINTHMQTHTDTSMTSTIHHQRLPSKPHLQGKRIICNQVSKSNKIISSVINNIYNVKIGNLT